jgi:mannose-6-phosphate isomerase-like protein (cupin superfamily)
MLKASTRRQFLSSAPLAAAAVALPLTELAAEAQTGSPIAPSEKFHLTTGAEIEQQTKALHAKPGNFNIIDAPKIPLLAVLTVEDKKAAKEFEWHEGRDHLLQVLEGSCIYEVGGTPKNGRNTKPGEWLAPESEGATKLMLHKGDWLLIPRNTPHKRTTETSVTVALISSTGALTT